MKTFQGDSPSPAASKSAWSFETWPNALCRLAFPVSYLSLIFLYGAVGYSSFGYDDEFFNITYVEKYGIDVVSFVQSTDVHPPGSYFINWVLFDLLKEWSLVRLINSVFTASCLIYFINHVKNRFGPHIGAMVFIYVGINPAILMWCTGLRWYAYFVPLLLFICITPNFNSRWYWPKLFIGLLLLGYLSYAVFIVALPLLLIYWNDCPDGTKIKIRSIFLLGSTVGILYAYQLIIFITVHVKYGRGLTCSLLKSIVGFYVAQISNQGVFPSSLGGIMSAAGFFGLVGIGVIEVLRARRITGFLIIYGIGTAGLILTGLGGKFRNFVILCPFQALWLSTFGAPSLQNKTLSIFLALTLAGNGLGIINVVRHQGTTKNSWNMPTKEAINRLRLINRSCSDNVLVLTHDEALTYFFEKSGYHVYGPYTRQPGESNELTRDWHCIATFITYAGEFADVSIRTIYRPIESLRSDAKEVYYIGKDADHKLKQMIDKRYPEHQIEIHVLRNPRISLQN